MIDTPDSLLRASILHLKSYFKSFLRQENRNLNALGKTPVGRATAIHFLLKEAVHRPFHHMTKIVRQDQSHVDGVVDGAFTR